MSGAINVSDHMILSCLRSAKRHPAGDPWLSVRSIAGQTGLNDTTCRRRLALLEAFGAVRRELRGNSVKWRVEEDREEPEVPTTVAERDELVHDLLKEKGPLTTYDLATLRGESRELTYLSVWRLMKAGRATLERDGTRTPRYAAVTDEGQGR